MIDEDQNLVARVASGDDSALAALYDRWAGRIHTVAFSILLDAAEAEDIVEETFFQAWRSAGRFDLQRGTVSTWLTVIARSRALDQLRRRRRVAATLATARNAEELPGCASPDGAGMSGAEAEQVSRSEALATELAALPPQQRTLIELAFFHGLTHYEIAAQTGLPLGTIKTRIRLAMQKLRQRLAAEQGEGW